jgi:hypothetical protein
MRCGPSSAAASALVIVLAGCGPREQTRPTDAVAAQTPAAAAVPHGDHNPRHGGVVMMKGSDLHYEVVLDPSARSYRIFFSDAVREDLPASIARDVSVTLKRPSIPDEHIRLTIDEAGESWFGHGSPVTDPDRTTARVAFTVGGEPYWIDLPFRQAPANTRR